MTFYLKGNAENNGFEFPTKNGRREFLEFLKKNPGIRFILEPITPESRKQRGFYHGAVLALWAYLDGRNYKDSKVIETYHEIAKIEFNGEIVKTKGRTVRIGKSSKGQLNKGYLERVIDNLVENYGVDQALALNPKLYQHFKDVIYSDGKYDTFIDYMKDLNYLPVIHS